MTEIRRVLVANRGEIALRIIRACFDEGLESVLVVSAADVDSLPAKLADRVVVIGPASPSSSYLDVSRVVTAALATGCDAVHPGYGFLSEQSRFAQACLDEGLVFVGPSVDTLDRGGDKLLARELARSLDIPLASGSGAVDADTARGLAADIGYPILIKAAAGGGGRGMGLVRDPAQLDAALDRAASEAREAFGDDRLFLERFVERARHIEVQVLGDTHGNIVHLGERDCSVQRRYQKLVEEAPAFGLSDSMRERLGRAATRFAQALDYVGAGTVEFLVDAESDEFFFLEMNTRVQVEHPVTEVVTGIDIVRMQLRIAAGQPLGFTQDDVSMSGHAIEFRITAEDPTRDFQPSPGRLTSWVVPSGEGVRIDTHCFPGYLVPPYYDSLLAKVIASGVDRQAALAKARQTLGHVGIDGVQTTLGFHTSLLESPTFIAGAVTTRWIESEFMVDTRVAG